VAGLADRILRGARPADLPFEQPNRFRLVINKKTLQTLGLSIPTAVMMRADEVVD
jgi:putative ABC transport system substrate-binding protein